MLNYLRSVNLMGWLGRSFAEAPKAEIVAASLLTAVSEVQARLVQCQNADGRRQKNPYGR
jgi:hypothetical protein